MSKTQIAQAQTTNWNISPQIYEILLKDQTSRKNIVWATDDYQTLNTTYKAASEIALDAVTGDHAVIRPRTAKSPQSQWSRTKEKAEVFTPSWVCNAQNNLIDFTWFGRKHVFNIETEKSWIPTAAKIPFSNIGTNTWKKYVDSPRLEITCGEAPYLVSRYDMVTAAPIPVINRIGLLDRKLRVVRENTTSEIDWYFWTMRAYQSIYGFEYQGDSLLLARVNLLYTFIDYLYEQFHRKPTLLELTEVATIISWNIWQMDGLTFRPPLPESDVDSISLPYCKIKDWQAIRWKKKGIVEYRSLFKTKEL